MRRYGGEFLTAFYPLFKQARDDINVFKLVLIVNSENAIESLKLMNGGDMVEPLQVPKVAREAVVNEFGEDFGTIFDQCNHCIGIALDYAKEKRRSTTSLTDSEYYQKRKESYAASCNLIAPISRAEHTKFSTSNNSTIAGT